MIGKVSRFSSTDLHGFVSAPEGDEIFFHAQDFHRLQAGEPFPILGERVQVEGVRPGQGRRARASRVQRLDPPTRVEGTVSSFDAARGWGFAEYGGAEKAFLHRQDFGVMWLPVIGSRIQFFVGYSAGRPRACWARPIPLLPTR